MEKIVRKNGTVVQRLRSNGVDCIVKVYGHRSRNLRDFRQQLLRFAGKQMPIDYRPPIVRRKDERTFLEVWASREYKAPRLLQCPEEYSDRVALCIEYLPGDSLRTVLRTARGDTEIEAICDALLAEMRVRHLEAFEQGERRLIHIDANTSNIIVTADGFARIDFDSALCLEPIERTAAREVKSLALGILNDVPASRFQMVVDKLTSSYGLTDVLQFVLRMGGGPMFRDLQRWGHRRFRPSRRHVAVTKFDLADWLRERTDGPGCR